MDLWLLLIVLCISSLQIYIKKKSAMYEKMLHLLVLKNSVTIESRQVWI